MEKLENFDSLQDLLAQMDDNVNIISGDIPVETQMEYYKLLEKITKDNPSKEVVTEQVPMLFNPDIDHERKKEILVSMALFDDVTLFRTIEKYRKSPDTDLKHWADLAYFHAKTNLENAFLPQKKILISTGLGGKDNKLRYFVVLLKDNRENAFTDTQKKVITNEIDIVFQENNVEIETIEFFDTYVTLKMLISLKTPVQSVFHQIIDNCNDLGRFMSERFIVTNVKELGYQEIQDIISENKKMPED